MPNSEQENQGEKNKQHPQNPYSKTHRKGKMPSSHAGTLPTGGIDTNNMTEEEKRERNREMVKTGAQSEYNLTQLPIDERRKWQERDRETRDDGQKLAKELDNILKYGWKNRYKKGI